MEKKKTMNQVTPAALDLARWLLSQEAMNDGEPEGTTAEDALRVLEKMRAHLSKLIGVAGFAALLSRALALAKAEVFWLDAVRVKPDGTLEGLSDAAQRQSYEGVASGSAQLLAQFLGLLISFVGENLTLRLMLDVWSGASLNIPNFGAEDTPE